MREKAKNASSVVFVNFHGLNVSAANELRKSLRKTGSDYLVAKKTLIKKVFDSLNFEGVMPELEGEVALAFGVDDEVAPARVVSEFDEKHNDIIKILGGVLEGEYMDANKAIALARIPSREVLYGKFVNVINSPVQGLVGTLQGTIKNFVSVLSQIK